MKVLWFDVENERYTTARLDRRSHQRCGLM